MGASKSPGRWRGLIAPGIASAVSLAILIGLGVWQLERKGEKEALIGHIIARSHEEPPAQLPASDAWDPKTDEFRRVRVTGTLQNDKETLVHGLAAGDVPGRALQGFYVITPLVRADGSTVLINRGFVPTELKNPADRKAGQIAGETTLTGILRASEVRTMFVPAADPARGEWFNRDIAGIAAAKGLGTVPPYLIEADAAANPGGWPRGGQLRVDLPNNHLQYAFTWFGIAACLVGVFSVFAWRKLNDPPAPSRG
ncbi:SURF1 family protein [Methylobacterium haplocladii]|uniref:SURF1 family protein n=1 Tax=Methylobacterium haplocladii TaxID=1176176 RepID=UPI003570C888